MQTYGIGVNYKAKVDKAQTIHDKFKNRFPTSNAAKIPPSLKP